MNARGMKEMRSLSVSVLMFFAAKLLEKTSHCLNAHQERLTKSAEYMRRWKATGQKPERSSSKPQLKLVYTREQQQSNTHDGGEKGNELL